MLKRIIASTVMATATHTMRPSRSQRPRKEEVAGGEACALISPTPRPSSLVPSVTTPLYSTTVSRALRQPLRSRRSRTNFGESPKGELRRIPIPRTPVNKDKKEGPQPRRPRPFPLFPPLSACFLLSWEELEELRMQPFEEALRDGRNEFIFRTQAEEHLLAVGGEHVFAVDYHPVEAAAARNYVYERWPVDGSHYVVAVSAGDIVCGKFAVRPVDYKIITFFAQYDVGASAADN